jgi:hypothetical protein
MNVFGKVWIARKSLGSSSSSSRGQTLRFHTLVTQSQLLEGPKCESQTEDNKKARSQSTLPGSQHLKGVEGRVGALGWD